MLTGLWVGSSLIQKNRELYLLWQTQPGSSVGQNPFQPDRRLIQPCIRGEKASLDRDGFIDWMLPRRICNAATKMYGPRRPVKYAGQPDWFQK